MWFMHVRSCAFPPPSSIREKTTNDNNANDNDNDSNANRTTRNAQVLATFQEEVSSWGAQEGVMVGMPAVVTAGYGKGVVLCMSPHPESTPEPPSLNHSRGKPRFRRLVQRAVLHVCRIPHPAETAAAEAEAAVAARR
jgi:hypothetical protein